MRKGIKDNEELRNRLSKYEESPKNSGNSNTPPSKEKMKDEIIRRTKSLRKPSGKKPRGQPGLDCATLEVSETPDLIVGNVPQVCDKCHQPKPIGIEQEVHNFQEWVNQVQGLHIQLP